MADEQRRSSSAVLTRSADGPLSVERIELNAPGPGEVRVRIEAASLCHSDLSLATGVMTQIRPAVLGHEAAGRVVELGAGVTDLRIDDPVLLLWNPPCRQCWFCTHGEAHLCEHATDRTQQPYALDESGEAVYPGLSTAAFAEQTVVAANACYRLPEDIPLAQAALLGCAVTTGVGAVRTTAQVRPGESVVIIGLGGVGLSAVQGARIAGASTVIAIDRVPEKLELARSLGATAALPAGDEARKQVRELTEGRGADHVFDCVGLGATIKDGWKMTRRGGTVTVVGIGGRTETVDFTSLELFYFARKILPCMNGSLDADRDLPEYLDQVRSGTLDLDSLVSREIDLSGVAQGFRDLAAGTVARVLVRPNG